MKKDFLFYMQQVPKARLKPMFFVMCACLPAILAVVRFANLPLDSSLKIFATAPTSSPLQGLDATGLSARLSVMERDTFISSQESLVTSQIVYRKVKEALKVDDKSLGETNASLAKRLRTWSRPFKMLLFGEEYVVAREQYVDWDYLAFKKRVKFSSELDAASFTIAFSDPDPERALRITQALANSLIELNQSLMNEQTSKTVAFLGRKIEDTRKELAQSADQIVAFVRENSFPNNEKYVDLRYQSMLDTMVKVSDAKAKVLASQAMLKTVKTTSEALSNAIKGKITDLDASKVDALLAEIQRYQIGRVQGGGEGNAESDRILDQKLAAMKTELGKAADTGFGAGLLDLPRLRELYSDTARQESVLESEVASASKYLQESTATLQDSQNEVARFPELQAKMSQLMIDHSRIIQVLTVLTEMYYKSLIQSDSQFTNLFVIEDPAISSSSASSKPMMLLSLLVFTATLISVAWAAHAMLRGTVFSSEQLKAVPQTTYVGAVPRFKMRKDSVSVVHQALINDTVSRLGYAVKKRVTSAAIPGHVIVVSGGQVKLGKSVSAVIVAYSLQRKGLKVALVDFDVRAVDRNVRTQLPRDVLVNEIPPHANVDAVVQDALRRADGQREPVIFHFSQSVDSHQSATADGPIDSLTRTLSLLRREVDVIVVDGPPLFVSDACLLVEQADSIVLCCKQAQSRDVEVEEAVAIVDRHRRPDAAIMTVLTQADGGIEFGSAARYRYSYERHRKVS